jgi:hypothetical protein
MEETELLKITLLLLHWENVITHWSQSPHFVSENRWKNFIEHFFSFFSFFVLFSVLAIIYSASKYRTLMNKLLNLPQDITHHFLLKFCTFGLIQISFIDGITTKKKIINVEGDRKKIFRAWKNCFWELQRLR